MSTQPGADTPDWLHGHAHEPNPAPPSADATLVLYCPDGQSISLTPDGLARLPQTDVPGCIIASTGHPPSGPFTFSGVRLADLVAAHGVSRWEYADIVSGDGFGARITAQEAHTATPPIILATAIDGMPLRRDQGLVRLIVPTESGDALRQVKWIARVEVHSYAAIRDATP